MCGLHLPSSVVKRAFGVAHAELPVARSVHVVGAQPVRAAGGPRAQMQLLAQRLDHGVVMLDGEIQLVGELVVAAGLAARVLAEEAVVVPEGRGEAGGAGLIRPLAHVFVEHFPGERIAGAQRGGLVRMLHRRAFSAGVRLEYGGVERGRPGRKVRAIGQQRVDLDVCVLELLHRGSVLGLVGLAGLHQLRLLRRGERTMHLGQRGQRGRRREVGDEEVGAEDCGLLGDWVVGMIGTVAQGKLRGAPIGRRAGGPMVRLACGVENAARPRAPDDDAARIGHGVAIDLWLVRGGEFAIGGKGQYD
jgi:hypothetical protein